jgi:iron complex outermembrane receptor protein
LQASLGNQKNKAKFSYSNLQSDGYRENNKTDRQTITIASNHFVNNSNKLTFVASYIDLKAFIPSSINEDDYLNNPTSSAFTWGRSKGFEDYKKGLFGLSWEYIYNNNTKQKTSVFTSFLDSYEPRPFNILQEETYGIGLRTRVISKVTLFQKQLDWTLGGEFFKDSNSYQTFENLYNDFPPEEGSVQGDLSSDFKEKRDYINVFFDSSYKLSETMTTSFGFNINHTSYSLNDKFIDDGVNFSGDFDFNTIISPKFGLTYQLTKQSILYASISHGFSPPSLEETLLPDGLINTNIKPESGWNYEIGSRGEIFNKSLHYDIAIYKMIVKDLLVARRTSDDQFIGVNAGKTNYNGIELSLGYYLLNSTNLKINSNNAFAYNAFKFDTFIDDSEDYSGNDLTGVPDFTLNSILNFDTSFGLYGLLNYNHVGKIPLRDDNTIYSESYQLVNSKLGYKSNETKKLQFDLFIGFNNILNEKYASMLSINASSFGGSAPRYYYPGEPSNYYAGLNLKYLLK